MRRLILAGGLIVAAVTAAVCSSCITWVEQIGAPIARELVEDGAIRFEAYDTLPTPHTRTLFHWPLRDHFDRMQKCSGHSRPFDQIEWFSYPGRTTFRSPSGKQVGGFWDGDRRIYLAGTPTTLDPPTMSSIPYLLVRHELLHYLTKSIGHPSEFFGSNGRCAVELELR